MPVPPSTVPAPTGAATPSPASPVPPERAPAEKHGLSRRRILEAALELADAEGLEALSMRRLGAILGVEAMSLYHHFPSKGALLDGLVELVMSQVPLPEELTPDWEGLLRRGFAEFRRLMLAHRAVFPLVATRPVADPEALAPVARAFAVLHAAGFTPREACSAWTTLIAYVFGYVDCEISGIGEASRGNRMWGLVSEHQDPAFTPLRLSQQTAMEWDDDAEFEVGLGAVISGLRARLASSG